MIWSTIGIREENVDLDLLRLDSDFFHSLCRPDFAFEVNGHPKAH
jgi:hypothetical protein